MIDGLLIGKTIVIEAEQRIRARIDGDVDARVSKQTPRFLRDSCAMIEDVVWTKHALSANDDPSAIFVLVSRQDCARIVVSGEDVSVNNAVLTSLALLLHEFATNAIKYGSLSVNGGRVEIEVSRNNGLALTWTEVDGPPARVPEGSAGFGSELERMTIASLRGSIHRDWRPDGVRILVEIPDQLPRR